MALLKDLTVFGATRLVLDTIAADVYSDGFHHNSHNNNDSVLLAGGGYQAITSLLTSGYWADKPIQTNGSNDTTPRFARIGLGTAVHNTYSINAAGVIASTLTSGAPFVINSDALNTNLNADLLDGYHADHFATSNHTHTFASITSKITSSNEFNFIDEEAASIWINRRRANNIIASTLTTNFSFGVGNNTATYAYLTAEGFKKNGSSDSYVLLGNGGHKLLTELKDADIITISKQLTVTEAWMDTGIITNANTFTFGDGTYVLQISIDSTLLYSGIIAIMTSGITGTDTEEIVLHCARKSNYQRLYIRTQNTSSGYAKIQIAAESSYSSAQTFSFKFRKLI